MSDKNDLDLSGLLAEVGKGSAVKDAPGRKAQLHNKPQSSKDLVNFSFKVPREFRHKVRSMAAERDISLLDLFKEAIELYEKKYH